MQKRIVKHAFSLLHVDYVRLDKNWNYRNVISPYFRLYLIDDGEGYIYDNKRKWLLEPGYMYMIPSYTLCNLKCSAFLGQYFIHFFEQSPDGLSVFHNSRSILKMKADDYITAGFKRLLHINPFRKINRSDNPKVYEKTAYYREYEELNNKQPDSVFLETQGILLQLTARMLDSEAFRRRDTMAVPARMSDLIGYIQLNLRTNFTVQDMAARVNLHPDYFSRLFLQVTGQRPLAYIREKRIERAQYLMVTSTLSFSQIAEQTGFENVPYFSRVFKKVTSLTPGQYRSKNLWHNML